MWSIARLLSWRRGLGRLPAANAEAILTEFPAPTFVVAARLLAPSDLPPSLVPAPWSPETQPPIAAQDGELVMMALRKKYSCQLLGPFSPVYSGEWKAPQRQLVRASIRRLIADGGFWRLGDDPTLLADGDVIEAQLGDDLWHSWVVRFPNHSPRPTGLGPLTRAFELGAFSYTESSDGRMAGVLRAGTFAHSHGSLEMLRRILASDVGSSLVSLRLHVAQLDSHLEWSSYIAAHRRLALGAPFRLCLCSPLAVNGAEALAPLTCEQVPGFSSYGCGTKWQVPLEVTGPRWCLRNSRVASTGWTTLEPGDWIEERAEGRLVARHRLVEPPKQPVAPSDSTVSGACVSVPAERWRQVPLDREDELHVLRLDGKAFRFTVSAEGVRPMLPNLSPGSLWPWFSSERLDGRCVVFLPRPSPFLAGDIGRRTQQGAASKGVLGMLMKISAADAAFEGLHALAAGEKTWLTKLLAPYCFSPEDPRWVGGFSPDDVELSDGMPSVLTLAPWLDFERDLRLLLMHPLLEHLRVLVLRSPFLTGEDVASLRALVHTLRPSLRVEARVLKFVSPRVV